MDECYFTNFKALLQRAEGIVNLGRSSNRSHCEELSVIPLNCCLSCFELFHILKHLSSLIKTGQGGSLKLSFSIL